MPPFPLRLFVLAAGRRALVPRPQQDDHRLRDGRNPPLRPCRSRPSRRVAPGTLLSRNQAMGRLGGPGRPSGDGVRRRSRDRDLSGPRRRSRNPRGRRTDPGLAPSDAGGDAARCVEGEGGRPAALPNRPWDRSVGCGTPNGLSDSRLSLSLTSLGCISPRDIQVVPVARPTPNSPEGESGSYSTELTWFSAITQRPSTLRKRRVLMPSCGLPPP